MKVVNWDPSLVSQEIMDRAMNRLEKAGEVVANSARLKVPVGKTRMAYTYIQDGKTYERKWSAREAGALKKSIRVTRLKGDPKLNIRVYAGGKDTFYSRFVEYGTVKMKARPFLRPALSSSKASIMNIMENG